MKESSVIVSASRQRFCVLRMAALGTDKEPISPACFLM